MQLGAAARPDAAVKGSAEPVRGMRPTPARRLLKDRLARWVISAGGMAIIASILGILVFILIEVYPLVRGARVAQGSSLTVDAAAAGGAISDEYRSQVAVLSLDGTVHVYDAQANAVVAERGLEGFLDGDAGERLAAIQVVSEPPLLTASTTSGQVWAVPVEFEARFENSTRIIDSRIGSPAIFDLETGAAPVIFSVRLDTDGNGTAAALAEDGQVIVVHRETEENMFTQEVTESFERHTVTPRKRPTRLLLDYDQFNLYATDDAGGLTWWELVRGRPGRSRELSGQGAPITAMSLLIGDDALVLGREDGSLEIAFASRDEEDNLQLLPVRDFPRFPSAVRLLATSARNKGFMAQDEQGNIGLYHSTSERTLWTARSPAPDATALDLAPRANGAFLMEPGRLAQLDIDNPHPEVSWKSLFGKVWYERYPEPEYVWQSSAGTDDFEPKLSLVPLMIGTLKGTVYSLFLAIPLGVLGAMYTSQFMHPSLRRYVKPSVEIMAALPSVVLGFIAGLWLAPRIERLFPALLLMGLVLPVVVVLTGMLWRWLPRRVRNSVPTGSETLLQAVALFLGMWFCLQLNHGLERVFFGGDFQASLLRFTGLGYDQRNAVVVGLAMGFAVIPIIFSIAEDAFSNVPRNLVSGSLALGANRWQTVTRVVLPTASPGIFSAIMIGFGRAVGETMIVLMATGNTPLMDWNPFNGFRTLSANIAVEIPEAPHGATLYRTLFLAALILFIFTFLLNTVAEAVRQRLRRRYAEL